MLLEKERLDIIAYGMRMNREGLSRGTSGNLSCYDPESGYMAISPSGMDYGSIQPEDVVIMDLNGAVIEGARKPSGEYGLHAALYRLRPEARAVVHAHSPYCTTFACLRLPLKAVHYAISGAGVDEVPCAEYATFGTAELADSVGRAIGESQALLLANHGMLAVGRNMSRAFSLAVNLEFVAEMQWRTMCVGQPVILSPGEMDNVRQRMRSYGQAKRAGEATDTVGY